MSDPLPISPARFAEALQELSLPSLHLKVLELRNDIAHLDYSNEQLLPFAEGRVPIGGGSPSATPTPDPDCIDAIRENQAVVARKLAQIALVRAEVEARGGRWADVQSKEEGEQQEAAAAQRAATAAAALAAGRRMVGDGITANGGETNGATNGATATSTHNPWTDGTFQTGTIRNGVLQMDAPAPGLADEQLRRALEERLQVRLSESATTTTTETTQNGTQNGTRDGDDDSEAGLHL